MRKYTVTSNYVVFNAGGKDYCCKAGDVIELNENDLSTLALINRKRISDVKVEHPKQEAAPVAADKEGKTLKK